MTTLDSPVFDADNHYYEALDAFTRHLDPALGPRVIEWVEIGGRRYHAIGGRVSRAVTNPTFDPISPAGALFDYFRGNPDGVPMHQLMGKPEPIRPEYRDRDARLATMDAQGIAQVWLFPTLGMLYEELLKDDPEAVVLLVPGVQPLAGRGLGHGVPGPHLRRPLHHAGRRRRGGGASSNGRSTRTPARSCCGRPRPFTANGPLSPAADEFDPFWARANEAGITVVVHAGDAGLSSNGYAVDGFRVAFKGGGGYGRPSVKMFAIERAAHDWLATLILEKLFDRFPNVRVASVENGSEFLAPLFRKLRTTARRMPGYFSEDPVDTFRRHVWINPFWEDDVDEIVDRWSARTV